jgi:hypothetical protein
MASRRKVHRMSGEKEQWTVRLDQATRDRIDALTLALAPAPEIPIARTDVMRAALAAGLEALEARTKGRR